MMVKIMTEAEVYAQLQEAGISVSPLGHFISEIDFARAMSKGLRTVQVWRENGTGPAHSAQVGRVCYSCADIADWMNACAKARRTVQPAAE
jgi:hypothetical protein